MKLYFKNLKDNYYRLLQINLVSILNLLFMPVFAILIPFHNFSVVMDIMTILSEFMEDLAEQIEDN